MNKQERDRIRKEYDDMHRFWLRSQREEDRAPVICGGEIKAVFKSNVKEELDRREYLLRVEKYIPVLLDALDALEAERDSLKARCEALERALNGYCVYCINAEKAFPDLPDSSAVTCDNMKKRNIKGAAGRSGKDCPEWQFDEARFATKGELS